MLSAYLHFLSHKWKELGLHLGLPVELLDAILAHTMTVGAMTVPSREYHFRMMLIAWIRRQNGKSNPAVLARALSTVGADTWDKWSVLVQSKQAPKSFISRSLPVLFQCCTCNIDRLGDKATFL